MLRWLPYVTLAPFFKLDELKAKQPWKQRYGLTTVTSLKASLTWHLSLPFAYYTSHLLISSHLMKKSYSKTQNSTEFA